MQHRFQAPAKIVAVAVGGLLVAASLVSFSLSRLSTLGEATTRLDEELVPAQQLLAETRSHRQAAGNTFYRALLVSDPTTRGELVTEAYRSLTASSEAWAQYRARIAGLPGEDTLLARFDRVEEVFSEASDRLGRLALADPELDDPETLDALAALDRLAGGADDPDVVLGELTDLYDEAITDELAVSHRLTRSTGTQLRLLAGAGLAIALTIAVWLAVLARRRDREVALLERKQLSIAQRNEFEATLQRALELANDERAVFEVARAGMPRAAPDLPATLMIASASGTGLRTVATSAAATSAGGDTTEPGRRPGANGAVCPVRTPEDCVATRRGQPFVFPSSGALDACPYLRNRATGPCSAACVPVSIAGSATAVLHVTADDGEPPGEDVVERLQLVAQKVGEKLGTLRAFARSETQASTDPLTGMLNRRSFFARAEEVVASGSSYTVVFADLDHFKVLNDTYGHDAGDRALRLFARTLCTVLRPQDLACRYGGEEFVVLLPECGRVEGLAIAERVRASVSAALDGGSVPAFTVSAGVATSEQADSLDDVVDLADHALLAAKAAGRDRVVLASTPSDVDSERAWHVEQERAWLE
jgi:diguanylate cyclase (GGDEF)-like protein